MKFKTLILAISCLAAFACNSQNGTMKKNINLDTELDSVSYSLGITMAENIKKGGVEKINAEALAVAFNHIFDGEETLIEQKEAENILNNYFRDLQMKVAEKNKQAGIKFLEENKTKEGVVTTESGLQYKIIKKGTGAIPKATDKVTTNYKGTLIDGTVFDSSYDRGEPATFPVNGVIKGWTEALQLMPVGSKWELYIPSELAYGSRGAGQVIGPDATLVFEIELISIDK
ncbi:MAG: FKBP-type peptidyl-prolyl cis-trans isomerase [Bacteroidetes bacterium]|nr:MAG: FKBP-type peptidyl-prolyl cis-trans isomerase [Bacteroidota bacterium]